MEDNIITQLFELEREKEIHIINARERGSRMLGVPHEDSDWDVLFIFAQEAANYATIHGRIDSIHEPHLGEDEEIDLHGWNIDKFGDLLADSNPNAIEYCRPNPKEYIRFVDDGVFERMASDARKNFNRMSLYHHYISMAKSNYKKYIESGKDCTKGRQFYVARALAAAQYIRRTNELPPMDVLELADSGELSEALSGTLMRLAEAKDRGHGPQENPDIVGGLYAAESEAPMLPNDERTRSPDTELIDDFIRTALPR